MKKLMIITIIACFSLILMQVLWIKSTYNMYKDRFSRDVDMCMYQAFSHELRSRGSGKKYDGKPSSISYKLKKDMSNDELEKYLKKDSDTLNIVNLASSDTLMLSNTYQDILFQIQQDIMMRQGKHLNLEVLDSIFIDLFKITDSHCIIKIDKNHNLIENYGDILPERRNIVSSKLYQIGTKGDYYVQAKVRLPMNKYIGDLIFILSVSVLIMFLVFAILVFQLVVIRQKDALLTARENTINGTIHDLKSPLSNVVTLLEWLSTKEDDVKKRDFLALSKKKVLHLISDIEQLLLTAKGSKGKPVLRLSEVGYKELIDGALSKVSTKLSDKPHTIDIIDSPDGNTIYCDVMYAENVVRNIIENALKYSDNGVIVTIQMEHSELRDVIIIRDNGWGIEKKYLRKVFKQYYQIPSKRPNGFGIGLFYVKSIMEAHGGRVTIDSVIGEGSVVKCYFKTKINHG